MCFYFSVSMYSSISTTMMFTDSQTSCMSAEDPGSTSVNMVVECSAQLWKIDI